MIKHFHRVSFVSSSFFFLLDYVVIYFTPSVMLSNNTNGHFHCWISVPNSVNCCFFIFHDYFSSNKTVKSMFLFKHFISASGFILWNLLIMTSQYFGSSSSMKHFLFNCSHAISVDQLHPKQSITVSFCFVKSCNIFQSVFTGFCVGWTLSSRSHSLIIQDRICLYIRTGVWNEHRASSQSAKLFEFMSPLLSRTIRQSLWSRNCVK